MGPALYSPNYHQVAAIPIGGEGFWDYLTIDSDARRLYVTRGTHVMVIDTQARRVVGDIPNTPGVHGVAVAPRLGRGFVSNGRDNSVTVFDLKSLKAIQRVPVGQNPDAIVFDAPTGTVWTLNGASHDATVLDAATGKVLATVALGGKPEFCVSDGRGALFVNIEDTGEIAALDAKARAVTSRWSIAPGEEASGLALDRAHHRLFAVCDNRKMAVVDIRTGKVLATPAIGEGPDACVFDAKANLAFSSNGRDGTLTVVDGARLEPVATVPTQAGARTMTLDPKTGLIYLITARFRPAADGQRPQLEPGSATILVFGK